MTHLEEDVFRNITVTVTSTTLEYAVTVWSPGLKKGIMNKRTNIKRDNKDSSKTCHVKREWWL